LGGNRHDHGYDIQPGVGPASAPASPPLPRRLRSQRGLAKAGRAVRTGRRGGHRRLSPRACRRVRPLPPHPGSLPLGRPGPLPLGSTAGPGVRDRPASLSCRAPTRSVGRGEMRIVSFLTDPPVVRQILEHLDLPVRPSPLAPARAPAQHELLSVDPPSPIRPPRLSARRARPLRSEPARRRRHLVRLGASPSDALRSTAPHPPLPGGPHPGWTCTRPLRHPRGASAHPRVLPSAAPSARSGTPWRSPRPVSCRTRAHLPMSGRYLRPRLKFLFISSSG
jgi:hypothetical protein